VKEAHRGVMGQTQVVKLLPICFNKQNALAKALPRVENKYSKQANNFFFFPKYAVISENNEIENNLLEGRTFWLSGCL